MQIVHAAFSRTGQCASCVPALHFIPTRLGVIMNDLCMYSRREIMQIGAAPCKFMEV